MKQFFVNASPFVAWAALVGCGNLGPGDYVVYRLAAAPSSLGADCYPDGEIPDSLVGDSNTFLNATTLVLFRDSDGSVYVELEGVALAGTDNGKGSFSFSGSYIDVEQYNQNPVAAIYSSYTSYTSYTGYGGYSSYTSPTYYTGTYYSPPGGGGNDPYTLTDTEQVDVEMTVKNKGVVGTTRTVSRTDCSGAGCNEDWNDSCTITQTWVGTEVKDVEIKYEL